MFARCTRSIGRLSEAIIGRPRRRDIARASAVAAPGIARLVKIPKPPAGRSFANGIFRKAALRHFLREATVNCAPYIKFPPVPQGALITQRDSPCPRPDCNRRNLQLAPAR